MILPWSNTQSHVPEQKLGIALLVLYFVQSTLGAIIHWFKPHRPGRPVQNYAHAVLGLLIIALSFYEVRLGYKGEWTKATMRRVPGSVDKLFTVWAVVSRYIFHQIVKLTESVDFSHTVLCRATFASAAVPARAR